jgi:D-alanyl-lipoteichoic acid acyltransferase DltB (MBOAT superfamily)
VLHNLGFAYLHVRLIAWGVDCARRPAKSADARLAETFCWLLYPPCLRLGPVMRREQFLARFDEWKPQHTPPWRSIAARFGWACLGAVTLSFFEPSTPHVLRGQPDFFSHPELYATDKLIRLVLHIPVLIYLILWTYNELAAAAALWIGIPVDNNFDCLPKATSVRDFWRRWHITLGSWLRDYIYVPLGGNRGFVLLHYAAVFGFCAVWHGPAVSFLVWGGSQVLALYAQRGWDRWREARGWQNWPRGIAWTGACWVMTMIYQIATIFAFADFEHFGLRVFAELLRRATG